MSNNRIRELFAWNSSSLGGNNNRILLALVGLLMVVNVLLIVQNLSLRSRIVPQPVEFLGAGDAVPPLEGWSLAEDSIKLDYASGTTPTVLLFLSPSCRFCEELLPNWQNMIGTAQANGMRVTAVVRAEESRQAVAEYLKRWEVPSLDIIFAPPETIAAYGFHATPITMVVDPGGRVQHNWIGAWNADQAAEVEEYFDFEATAIEDTSPPAGQS